MEETTCDIQIIFYNSPRCSGVFIVDFGQFYFINPFIVQFEHVFMPSGFCNGFRKIFCTKSPFQVISVLVHGSFQKLSY